jgi:hypothetical protein
MAIPFDGESINRLNITDIENCCALWEQGLYDFFSAKQIKDGEGVQYINDKIKKYAELMELIQQKKLDYEKIQNNKERDEKLRELNSIICRIELHFQEIGTFVLAGNILYGKDAYYEHLNRQYQFKADEKRGNGGIADENERLRYTEACFRNYDEGKFTEKDLLYALTPYFENITIGNHEKNDPIFAIAAREAITESGETFYGIELPWHDQVVRGDKIILYGMGKDSDSEYRNKYFIVNDGDIKEINDLSELEVYIEEKSGGKLFDEGYGIIPLLAKGISREQGHDVLFEDWFLYDQAVNCITENGIVEDTKNLFFETVIDNNISLAKMETVWDSSVKAYTVYKDQYWDTTFKRAGKVSEMVTNSILYKIGEDGIVLLTEGSDQVFVCSDHYLEKNKAPKDAIAYCNAAYWIYEEGKYGDTVMLPVQNRKQLKAFIEMSLIRDEVIEPVKHDVISNSILEEALKNSAKVMKEYDLVNDGTIWKSNYTNPKGDTIYTLQWSRVDLAGGYHTDVWHFRHDFSVRDAWLFMAKQDYTEKKALYQRVNRLIR